MVGSVLIADAEPCGLLREALCQDGFHVDVATTRTAALAYANDFDVVIADIRLGLLAPLKARAPATEVVLVTCARTLDQALVAIHRGAFDYVLRPFFVEDISLTVACAAARRHRVGFGSVLLHVRKNHDLSR